MTAEEIREGDIVDIDYITEFTKEHINEGKALVIWKGFNHQPLVRKLNTKTTIWISYKHIARVVGHIDIEGYMDKLLNMAESENKECGYADTALDMAFKALERVHIMSEEEFNKYLNNEDLIVVKRKVFKDALEQQPCEDCISRAEAIENFASWYGYDYDNQGYYRLLKQMPSVTPSYNSVKTELKPRMNLAETSQDTISREALRQKLQDHHDFFVNAYGNFKGMSLSDKARVDEIDNCIAMVVNAPSVTPQQKATGSWVEKQVVDNEEVEIEQWQSARCSKCDKYHTTPYSYYFDDYKYCPNCGAKMEVQ